MSWSSQTNADFAKSENFKEIKDAKIIDCYLHIACY